MCFSPRAAVLLASWWDIRIVVHWNCFVFIFRIWNLKFWLLYHNTAREMVRMFRRNSICSWENLLESCFFLEVIRLLLFCRFQFCRFISLINLNEALWVSLLQSSKSSLISRFITNICILTSSTSPNCSSNVCSTCSRCRIFWRSFSIRIIFNIFSISRQS